MEEEVKQNLEVEEIAPDVEPAAEPEVTPEAPPTDEPRPSSGASLKSAIEKSMESLSKALSNALENRGNVVMVRVNDDALRHLDMLVEAEVTKSRSESAAFLINEGIAANQSLFEKIEEITEQIGELREQLRQMIAVEEHPTSEEIEQ